MTALKRPGRQVIWPSNIDSTKTRGEGRKIPITRGVRQPNLREVTEAAKTLGLDPQPAEKMAKPSTYWDKGGYIEIKKAGSKIASLKSIAAEVVKVRQHQTEQAALAPGRRDRR